MKRILILALLFSASSLFGQDILDRHAPVGVASGKVKGWAGTIKFGRNATVSTASDPETVWATDGDFVPWANDSIITVVSTSGADSAGGTGALTVEIFGVDRNFARISEIVTIDGTSDTTATDSFRVIYRAVVLTAGSGLTNAGAITFKSPSGITALTIRAVAGQSETSVFPIAAGETAFMTGWHGSVLTAAADVTFRLEVFNVSGNVWNLKDIIHGRVTGNSSPMIDWSNFPLKISASSIIQITAVTDTDNSDVTGGYTVLYRDR